MITCKLCMKELKHIGSHLHYKHNISGQEYKQLFPEAVLMPPEYCVPTSGFTGYHHTDETKTLLRGRTPWWIESGKPNPAKSPEAREKISKKAKLRVWKEESKLKLSKTLRKKHKEDPDFHARVIAPLMKMNPWEDPETREKMIKSMKENHADFNGEKNPFFGKTHIPETIDKIRSSKYHQNLGGQANPNWLGGISYEPYGLEFNDELKEQIRARDRYTCQRCGAKQDYLKRLLSIHHIDYDKKNNNPENLIALCNSCNVKANYNREEWKLKYKGMVVG